uniref:Expressed protein n=1 Tax=Schizophyllum commune (strain H4-8 / FGSC 9210) TaxID=578458 RepID=D8PWS5_SCHCM
MTAKTSSASSEFVFPRSSSPAKEDLRANAHPYAIKTTSTGILSRSNSSPQHPPSHYKSSHHYVPAAPKKSERPARIHGHRYSRSLTSDSPRPLPAPPVSDSEDNASPIKAHDCPPRQVRRGFAAAQTRGQGYRAVCEG